jgi:hypothetical protein
MRQDNYSSCRMHTTLRVIPALEAGLQITFGALRNSRRYCQSQPLVRVARTAGRIQNESPPRMRRRASAVRS